MGILKLLFTTRIHSLEYDPHTQYRFNLFFAWIWFVLMLIIPFIPAAWGHSAAALIIQELSLWALFATHFGAMSAALAAHMTQDPNNTKGE